MMSELISTTPNDLSLQTEEMYESLAYKLSVVFANSYTLFIKLQSSHWNYIGSDFYSKHLLFERIYNEIYGTLDRIAENIRALDYIVPSCFNSLIYLSTIYCPLPNDKDFTENRLTVLDNDVMEVKRTLMQASIKATQENNQGVLNLIGDLDELYSSFHYLITSHIKLLPPLSN